MDKKIVFKPFELQKLIEKIELIPKNKLGIIYTNNVDDKKDIILFPEVYKVLTKKNIDDLVDVLNYYNGDSTIIASNQLSLNVEYSKRIILSVLNAVYLILTSNKQILKLIASVNNYILSDYNSKLESELTISLKAYMYRNLPVQSYIARLKLNKNSKQQIIDLRNYIRQAERKEHVHILKYSFKDGFDSKIKTEFINQLYFN